MADKIDWRARFQKTSEMGIDFTPSPQTRRFAGFGSDFEHPRERHFVPSPYKELGMPKGATRYPDYDPFGSDREAKDFPEDVAQMLPPDPARLGKVRSSQDDFSGFAGHARGPDCPPLTHCTDFSFGWETGGFGSGHSPPTYVYPEEVVGPPPRYRPPPGPGLQERVVVAGESLSTPTPLWAKLLGGVAIFLGGLFADKLLEKKILQARRKR